MILFGVQFVLLLEPRQPTAPVDGKPKAMAFRPAIERRANLTAGHTGVVDARVLGQAMHVFVRKCKMGAIEQALQRRVECNAVEHHQVLLRKERAPWAVEGRGGREHRATSLGVGKKNHQTMV